MDIEKIIDTYCSEHMESKKTSIRNWFVRVEKMASGVPLEERFRSKDFLLRCFSTSKANTVSRSQYQRIKEILLYIFDCCNLDKTIIPSRDEVIEASRMCCFFGDLQSAISFIDEIGNTSITRYNPNNGLVRLKSIVILTWLGFTPNEIVEIVRSDIKVGDIIYIQRGDKQIEISQELFKILSLQLEQDGVMTFPRGKIYAYKIETEHLIKNRAGAPMIVDNLYQLFKHFNKVANSLTILSFKGLQISSLFVQIREDKSDEDLYTKIQKHAHCDKRVSYGYKKIYSQWLKKFFNEEI